MSDFKEGDEVEIVGDCCSHGIGIGKVVILKREYFGHSYRESKAFLQNYNSGYVLDRDIKKINTNFKNMNIVEKFALLRKGEPEKSYFKAGITDKDDQLTPEGTKIYLSYLLGNDNGKFKTEVVDELLKYEEKK